MLSKRQSTLACALTLCGAFLLPNVAHAVPCDDLTIFPNKIFGIGGSAVTATLRQIAIAIANDPAGTPADQTTIFFSDPNACEGYREFLTGTTIRNFKYWVAGDIGNPLETDRTCEARIGGQPLDFAHMGNDAGFCPEEVPAGIGDFLAPVQTVNFVTHVNSNETSISAEALYFIYGFGQTGQAAPWTAGTGVYQRQETAFVQLLVGGLIDVPASAFKWPENTVTTNGLVVSSIATYGGVSEAQARQTLGYISGSTADAARGKNTVKTLAFKAYDQECAVYPDSTAAAFDKLNVRLGKYPLWSQGHYFTPVNANGRPQNPLVENFLGWFTGKEQPPGTSVSAFAETIKAGDIPECAMQVTSDGTLGPIQSYATRKPCGCLFEEVATGSNNCEACTSDADCGGDTPSCNFGYCELYRAQGEAEG